jgi:hypothetical protein
MHLEISPTTGTFHISVHKVAQPWVQANYANKYHYSRYQNAWSVHLVNATLGHTRNNQSCLPKQCFTKEHTPSLPDPTIDGHIEDFPKWQATCFIVIQIHMKANF